LPRLWRTCDCALSCLCPNRVAQHIEMHQPSRALLMPCSLCAGAGGLGADAAVRPRRLRRLPRLRQALGVLPDQVTPNRSLIMPSALRTHSWAQLALVVTHSNPLHEHVIVMCLAFLRTACSRRLHITFHGWARHCNAECQRGSASKIQTSSANLALFDSAAARAARWTAPRG